MPDLQVSCGEQLIVLQSAAELLRKATADLQTLQAAHQALHASHVDAERSLEAANAAAEQAVQEKQALAQQLNGAAADKVAFAMSHGICMTAAARPLCAEGNASAMAATSCINPALLRWESCISHDSCTSRKPSSCTLQSDKP